MVQRTRHSGTLTLLAIFTHALRSAHITLIPNKSPLMRSFFFFSSRRRHTRCSRDWSSDVCSSDLNRHINPTNICVAHCKLCAFGRDQDAPGAYNFALEEIYQRAEQGMREGALEFHIVGGLHPDLPFEYFLDMMRGLKKRCPGVHLKAFTMVEVGYFARIARLTVKEVLLKLKEAGVDSLPGGGAEIFHPRVRKIICDHKEIGRASCRERV